MPKTKVDKDATQETVIEITEEMLSAGVSILSAIDYRFEPVEGRF